MTDSRHHRRTLKAALQAMCVRDHEKFSLVAERRSPVANGESCHDRVTTFRNARTGKAVMTTREVTSLNVMRPHLNAGELTKASQ